MRPIKRALISVANKNHIVEFARGLNAMGITILSTGGTAQTLEEHGISVLQVSDYTAFPEMMNGRVKTLHPKVHAGLLSRAGIDDAELERLDIEPIDLLVVNLYPFEETIARPDCSFGDAIENIDIGGPAMLRAAAKNHGRVTVVVDPDDYDGVLDEMRLSQGSVSDDTRLNLATKTFVHTARYDGAISSYLSTQSRHGVLDYFPQAYNLQLRKLMDLRYGENPHQRAAFYAEPVVADASITAGDLIQGKALSFNNIADADAAFECVRQFYEPACVIVKHMNPCGAAKADTQLEAYKRAYTTDPVSAYGGIVAFNRGLNGETAETMLKQQFVEVVIAPEVDDVAREILKSKPNIRVLTTGWGEIEDVPPRLDFKRVNGGLLVQDADLAVINQEDIKVVSVREPTDHEVRDMLFAWKVAKFVKSNAIVYAKDLQTIGVGAGQTSRVQAAKTAVMLAETAGLSVRGSVMASDAFMPFSDSIDVAAEQGVTAIIQPGGSKRDSEVIAAADANSQAMIFTGMRHFRH